MNFACPWEIPFRKVAMTAGDQLDIHPNQTSGCYEAWLVDTRTHEKRLLSTCSLCLPEEQVRWWNRQVCKIVHEDKPLPAIA